MSMPDLKFAISRPSAWCALLVAALVTGSMQAAETPAPAAMPAAPASAAAPAPAPVIQPQAMDALKALGAQMRTMKSFTLHADTTIDEVGDDGQKLQFTGTVDFHVRRPDHLFAEINSDRRHRLYYYDSKTLTQYAPRMGYYATFNAPPTIGELLKVLDDKYDISFPLTDLFLWGTKDDDGAAITAAAFVGPATIAGQECDHFAYRQPDVDWQIWISAKHMPCKLVITTLSEEAQPQYTSVFTWHPDVKLEDKEFTFVAPKAAHKIEIAVADAK